MSARATTPLPFLIDIVENGRVNQCRILSKNSVYPNFRIRLAKLWSEANCILWYFEHSAFGNKFGSLLARTVHL